MGGAATLWPTLPLHESGLSSPFVPYASTQFRIGLVPVAQCPACSVQAWRRSGFCRELGGQWNAEFHMLQHLSLCWEEASHE